MMLVYAVLTLLLAGHVQAWDSDDLELFDLVEEVNRNFYEVLGLTQSASSSDIRRSYRKLSLQYHPDKNKEEGAEEKFRQIVAISEVLKDEQKRKKYDEVLEFGLPDWRQPVFYYRRVRKMGILELILFLFVLITIGQYLFFWSSYWEKKYELEEIFTSRLKKIEKKNKKTKSVNDQAISDIMADELEHLEKPKCTDLLPFQLIYLIVFLIRNVHNIPTLFEYVKSTVKRSEDSSEDEETGTEDGVERIRKPRKRHVAELPDFTGMPDSFEYTSVTNSNNTQQSSKDTSNKCQSTDWTEKDLVALTKAMKRFPGGCTDRWDKIAEMINKPASEVTKFAKKMKASSFSTSVPVAVQGLTGHNDENNVLSAASENDSLKKRKSTKVVDEQSVPKSNSTAEKCNGQAMIAEDSAWSQHQQKALELALQQFPKGCDERWDRISACVPDKSKEECMLRFKALKQKW